MQSGFAIGYALAAVVTALVLPRWGWRAVFFVGLLPALVTLWIRRGVEESPLWAAQLPPRNATGRSASRPTLFQLGLASHYRRPILVTLLMNAAALFGWWGLFTWIPRSRSSGLGNSLRREGRCRNGLSPCCAASSA